MKWVRWAVVGILALAATALYAWFHVSQSDLALNLATEATGILVTVVLIDGLIALDRRRETDRQRTVAIRALRRPIARHVSLLLDAFKATTQIKPTVEPNSVRSYLDTTMVDNLQQLDFKARAPVAPARSWRAHISSRTQECARSIADELQKYAPFLRSGDLEVFQHFVDSPLLGFFAQIGNIPDNRPGPFPMLADPSARPMIEEHLQRLRNVLNLLEAGGADPITPSRHQWADNVSPKLGSGRVASP